VGKKTTRTAAKRKKTPRTPKPPAREPREVKGYSASVGRMDGEQWGCKLMCDYVFGRGPRPFKPLYGD
jgi:hypothetical protein